MVKVTNDEITFFEGDNQSEIYIWGGGNFGYWIGYYLNKCDIGFSGYLENNVEYDGTLYCEHPIYKSVKLKEYQNGSLRIILSRVNTGETMELLAEDANKYNIDILFFSPRYRDAISPTEKRFNVNRFLGYFRRKLITAEIPTIISNDCTAARMYEAIGMLSVTPTNTVMITAEDYIKICKNPHKYFSEDIVMCEHRMRPCQTAGYQLDKDLECGRLFDVRILFAHNANHNDVIKAWNFARKKVNYNRLMYVYSDMSAWSVMTFKERKEFDNLSQEKLYICEKQMLGKKSTENAVYMKTNCFVLTGEAIENYFDLIGWINKDY